MSFVVQNRPSSQLVSSFAVHCRASLLGSHLWQMLSGLVFPAAIHMLSIRQPGHVESQVLPPSAHNDIGVQFSVSSQRQVPSVEQLPGPLMGSEVVTEAPGPSSDSIGVSRSLAVGCALGDASACPGLSAWGSLSAKLRCFPEHAAVSVSATRDKERTIFPQVFIPPSNAFNGTERAEPSSAQVVYQQTDRRLSRWNQTHWGVGGVSPYESQLGRDGSPYRRRTLQQPRGDRHHSLGPRDNSDGLGIVMLMRSLRQRPYRRKAA
jgi:hypothetical protein